MADLRKKETVNSDDDVDYINEKFAGATESEDVFGAQIVEKYANRRETGKSDDLFRTSRLSQHCNKGGRISYYRGVHRQHRRE